MQMVVRLLCLASIVSGGTEAKILERIKRDFLQVCAKPSHFLADPNTHNLDIRIQPPPAPFIAHDPSPLYSPDQPPSESDTM